MKFIFRLLACIVLPVSAFVMSGCQEKDTLGDTGFWGVSAPQTVMNSGEMVTISFETSDAWTIDPVTSDGEDWITVRATDNSESAGKGTVRISIAQNNGAARSVDVFITVSGFERSLLCTISQGEGSGEMNSAINEAMHSRLMEDYLWKDDYAALSNEGKIEMDAAWSDFLYTNLTKLGETNIEDGGRYREYSTLAGERYIYSYIEEVTSGRSQPQTRAASAYGLGLGPTMANPLYDGMSDVGLVIGYVYQGSPAYKAGLRRGDIIYSINGNKLNLSNYSSYQQELYYAPQGPYAIEYYRYEPLGGKLDLVARTLDQPLAMGTFPMSPVLLCTIFQGDTEYNGQTYKSNIGYFVLEAFDDMAFSEVKQAIDFLAENQIDDLILDLRFSPGGSVALCRYLMTAIVGPSHYNDVFAKMKFADGTVETWTYGGGSDKNGPDGFGTAADLGLDRLFVICSENTASAAEIVINSLKGIDGFEVHTYGSTTEGKNVGMVTSQITYGSRVFEFAPINYYVMNAKDFYDYPDGFKVDHEVNNQNSIISTNDDYEPYFPYVPIDWETSYNLEVDMALNWAYTNCLFGVDPEWSKVAPGDVSIASMTKSAVPSVDGSVFKKLPMKKEFGRYGNFIYGDEVITIDAE